MGNAWKKSGVNRDEIFLVSKVWHSNYGEGQTMKSIDESLRKLQTVSVTSSGLNPIRSDTLHS